VKSIVFLYFEFGRQIHGDDCDYLIFSYCTFLEVEGQESSASSFALGGDAFEQEMPILNDRRSHAISISSTATRFVSIS